MLYFVILQKQITTTMKTLNEAIERVKEGYSSQYIKIQIEGEIINVRVSDHKANQTRMFSNQISIVLCDEFPTWASENEIYVNNETLLDEAGMTIEESVKWSLVSA